MIDHGPRLLNLDRPLVIGTAGGEAGQWSREFGETLAKGLTGGKHVQWMIDEESQDEPETAARFLHVPVEARRLPHLPQTKWNLLLTWQSTLPLAGGTSIPLFDVSGIHADREGMHRLGGPDGRVLDRDETVRIASGTVASIFARCLVAGPSPSREQRDLNRLLTAIGSILPAGIDGSSSNVACAASHWTPAHAKTIGSDPVSEKGMEPEVERIVPCGMSISFDEVVDEGEFPTIRLDAFQAIIQPSGRTSIMEAMRTIRRGWPRQ